MRRYRLCAAPVTVLVGRPGFGPHCAVTTRLPDAEGILRVALGVVSSRGDLAELRAEAGQERVRVEVFASRAAALEELAVYQARSTRRYLTRCAQTQRQSQSGVGWFCGWVCCLVTKCVAP